VPAPQPTTPPATTDTPATVELDTLAELAARRLALAVDIAAAKHASRQQVEDTARERQILDWAAAAIGEIGPGRCQEPTGSP
jgi:hypothetical protein